MTPEEKEVSQKALALIWNVFYWTAFVLCWAVLPFLMNYVTTGDFTVQGKIKRALKAQARYYSIIGVLSVFIVLYLWWKNAFEK